jgi:quinol monooxygenase YgiN
MSKTALIARLPSAEGKRDELVAAFQPMLDHVNSEAGTEVYILHLDDGDENLVWVYERYVDADALAVHGGSDAMKALFGEIGPLMGGAPELIAMTPVGGKGL